MGNLASRIFTCPDFSRNHQKLPESLSSRNSHKSFKGEMNKILQDVVRTSEGLDKFLAEEQVHDQAEQHSVRLGNSSQAVVRNGVDASQPGSASEGGRIPTEGALEKILHMTTTYVNRGNSNEEVIRAANFSGSSEILDLFVVYFVCGNFRRFEDS